MTCNCNQGSNPNPQVIPTPAPCNCKGAATQPCGSSTTIHTPQPCQPAANSHPMHELRLHTLRCGTWVYAGQMSVNSPPMINTRIMWDNKAYTITQATLTGTEPALHGTCRAGGKDKWEVMLMTAGAGYTADGGRQPCTPCQPPVQPPIEPPGGIYINDPCTVHTLPYPITHQPYTPLPVEQGLGCGPQYTCTGYPR
jgi:hypothetical protein